MSDDIRLPIKTFERAMKYLREHRSAMSWWNQDDSLRDGYRAEYNELCDFMDELNKIIGAHERDARDE